MATSSVILQPGPSHAHGRYVELLKIVVDISVGGLYEIFDEANNLFQFVAFD
jgi:hypothetical protein